MVTVAALQQRMAEALGVEKVDFNDGEGNFVCRCGRCGTMKVSGGTVQGLYVREELGRLKKAHDARCAVRLKLDFKLPSQEVLQWLVKEAKVDVRDAYRMQVIERKADGGAEVMIWLYCRNREGKAYIGSDNFWVRKSIKMTCVNLPDFVEDEYGYPLTQYNDDKVLPKETKGGKDDSELVSK